MHLSSKAYEGDVKVSVVGDDEAELKSGVCEAKFDYQYNYVVTTFLGKLYENNTKWDVLAGPFDDCGAFDNIWRMMFDPNSNYDDLYWVGQRDAFRHVDFVNQYVDIKTTNIGQCADVNFTLNGDMVVVDDQSSDTNTVFICLPVPVGLPNVCLFVMLVEQRRCRSSPKWKNLLYTLSPCYDIILRSGYRHVD